MITRCKVKNFKSIRDEEDLEIRPLTIFTGANSSGKSTFIQSILLIAQTIIHKQIALHSVVLNGTFMSFGQFDDIKHNGSNSEEIRIRCTCKPLEDQMGTRFWRTYHYSPKNIRFDEISCDISFASATSHLNRDLAQIRPQIDSSRLSCNFTEIKDQSRNRGANSKLLGDDTDVKEPSYHNAYISLQNPAKPKSKRTKDLKEQYPSALACDIELDKDSKGEIEEFYSTAKPIGCIINHFVPELILCDINEAEESVRNISSILKSNFPRYNLFRRDYDFDHYFSEVVAALCDLLKEKDINLNEIFDNKNSFSKTSVSERAEVQEALSDISEELVQKAVRYHIKKSSKTVSGGSENVPVSVPSALSFASSYIDDLFSSSFKYLGPLRDAPRSLYPLSPATEPSDVGLRGEHTAAVIELCKDNIVRYIPSKHFRDDKIEVNVVTTTLENALSDWLQYLEVAKSVESKNLGKQGHAMTVVISDPKNKHELTHVGVGVSQVLPILVMGLLASPDTTLVFEQPELHLHPNVQFLLGDFFLSMALCDKQCIVESHSEHLVDQIRYRIASSSSNSGMEQIAKVYFAKKLDGVSSFEEVKIDKYGKIVNWPKGFFDQSFKVASKIMKSMAKKQKRSRRDRDEKFT